MFRIGLLLGIVWVTILPGVEPIPFGNPHPLSGSHFNPVMAGLNERTELTYVHASLFEKQTNTYQGNSYERTIDYESSQLSWYGYRKFGSVVVAARLEGVLNHSGVLDEAIVWVHDRTFSHGGRWKRRKDAPRNTYRFSVTDEEGNEYLTNQKRTYLRGEVYVGYEPGEGWLVRLGVKPPLEQGRQSVFPTGVEYALTLQKGWQDGPWSVIGDLSWVDLARDKTGLEEKPGRGIANLHVSYKRYYIQYNYTETVYHRSEDPRLNTYGGVYVLGYRSKTWFLGVMEDMTSYNNPDVALVFGLVF